MTATPAETTDRPLEVLEEIRQRADAATKGPWLADVLTDADDRPVVLQPDPDNDDRADILFGADAPWVTEADAEFVAHAREDIPRLLAGYDALLKLAADLDAKATGLWAAEQPTIADIDLTDAVASAHKLAAAKIRSLLAAALAGEVPAP